MRRLGFVLVSCVLIAAVAPAAAEDDPTYVGEHAKEFAEAADAGEPIEVVAERTSTETLFATPSGTYSREISSTPVRVRAGNGWKPADLTLERVDGSVRPKAAPGQVELSSGGDDPMIALSTGGVRTSVSWPTELPNPVLEGPTATYRDVYEDVDLRLTVTDGGVSQVLVVHNAEAAAHPALRDLDLKTEVEGGSLKSDGDGFAIIDKTGRRVGESPAPAMWDSSGVVLDQDRDPVADASEVAIDQRVEGPVEGDDVSAVDLSVGRDQLSLTPDSDALTGADVKYPLYIDPKASSSAFAWAMVFKQHPNSSFYKWTDSAGQGVGHQDYNGISTKRLFFQHSISGVTGSQILRATFKARMNWSASCATRAVKVYRAGAVTSDRTWNDQPAWGEYQDSKSLSAGWSGCNPSGTDVVWNVKNAVTDASAEGRPSVAFGLRVSDESDPLTWRRFRHTTSITVEYNRVPDRPSPRSINGISCPQSTVIRLGRMTELPVIRAGLSDPDKNNVRPRYRWNAGYTVSDATNPEILGSFVSSGSTATRNYPIVKADGETVPAGAWSFKIRAQDRLVSGASGATSEWSDECTFTVDPTAAATPRLLNAPGSVDNTESWQMGQTYTLQFAPGGSVTDVVGYRYAIDSNVPPTTSMLAATGTGHTHSKAFTFATPGLHTLRLWAYDAAGNPSEYPLVHPFEVVDPDASARSTYPFDEQAGDEANDTTGQFPMSIGSALRGTRAMFVDDDPDNPERDGMIGLSDATATLPSVTGAVIDPKRSFSIAAFVDPGATETSGAMTAVSVSGTNSNGVELGVEPNQTGFDYVFRVWDTTTNAWVTATVPGDDGLPGTRMVVATFDAVTGKLKLSVPESTAPDGESTTNAVPPTSLTNQQLSLGASRDGTRRWNGWIDQLVIARGPLTADEISDLLSIKNRAVECAQTQSGAC